MMNNSNPNETGKCKKWWWQDDPSWKEVQNGIFKIEYETKRNGITPYTYGVTVVVEDPRAETYFDTGKGVVNVSSGGLKRIFNYIFDTGKHTVCILGRTSSNDPERKWQKVSFDIDVEPRKDDPNCIIVNFFQSKAGGQMAKGATGLDVAFSLSLREKPESINWIFGDGNKKEESGPKAATLLSVSNPYTKIGKHEGHVEVVYNKKPCRREFAVVITDLGFNER